MLKLIAFLFSIWGSFASLLGCEISLHPNLNFGTISLIWLAALFFVAVISSIQSVKQYINTKPKVYRSQDEINNYMYNWISKGGRVTISTRDMSWGDSNKIQSLLIEKARKRELCICLPENTALTKMLKREGAEIYTYPQLEHTPTSRFTIIHKDSISARVAIGKTNDGNAHVIEEFSLGNHPAFAVANDYTELIIKFNKKYNSPKKKE